MEQVKKEPQKTTQLFNSTLDDIVAKCLKDTPVLDSDESGDENDPELLRELDEISEGIPENPDESPVVEGDVSELTKTLESKLKMYEEAEQNAEKSGETSRARRFKRGVERLRRLLRESRAGKCVLAEDIPPEVVITRRKEDH